MRLLIVSNYNVSTALTIASSGGYINTLLGTFIPLVPLLMPYLALALLFFDRIVLGILAFLAVVFTSPTLIGTSKALSILRVDWHLLLQSRTTEVVGFLFAAGLGLAIIALPTGQASKTVSVIAGFVLVPFVLTFYPLPASGSFYAEQLRQPWLPAETLVLATRQNAVGYVLSRDQDWFVVLIAQGRTIAYIHTGQVASQVVCQLKPTDIGRPLISLIKQTSPAPTCPALVPFVP
jgi:hypothetical protein